MPRALVADIRGSETKVVEGSRHKDGVKFRQNGEWDDGILCDLHERLIGSGDDYGIDFVRRVAGTPLHKEKRLHLSNPKPDALIQFAYATVWRFCVARGYSHLKQALGPYEDCLRRMLLAETAPSLQVLITQRPFHLNKESSINIAVLPYRTKLLSWNVWHFVVRNSSFFIKTDQRPFPWNWSPYVVNGNQNLQIPVGDSLSIVDVPVFKPIFARMGTLQK